MIDLVLTWLIAHWALVTVLVLLCTIVLQLWRIASLIRRANLSLQEIQSYSERSMYALNRAANNAVEPAEKTNVFGPRDRRHKGL